MSEIIRLRDHRDWAEWFIVRCVVEGKGTGVEIPVRPEGGLEVSLIVNGVELPVMATLRHMHGKHEEIIQREAKEMAAQIVQEKFGELRGLIEDAAAGLRSKMIEAGLLEGGE